MQHMQKQQRRGARLGHGGAKGIQDAHRTLPLLLLRVCAPAQKPVHKLSIINMQNLCICVWVCMCVYICEKRVEFKHQVNVRKGRAHWKEQGRDKQGKGKGKVATAAATCRKSKTPNETLQREEAAAAAETNECWKRTHTMPDTMWPRGGHAFVSELPRRIVASPCGEAQTRLVLCEFSTAYCCCCCCCCSTGALLRSSRNNP